MTNCINCGAILHGDKCEYCGTKYENKAIAPNFQNFSRTGILKIGNEKVKVYISQIESNMQDFDPWIDCNGFLHRNAQNPKRKFTLIEI